MLFLLWLFVFFGIAGALYLLARVPLPAVAPQTQTSFIYSANGTQLAAVNDGQNRVNVSLQAVPQVAIDAVVATEDHGFYQHGGIDLVGTIRALVSDLRGNGNLQGGSTITQQYVKQAYLNSQRTLVRKVKEAALAIRLQRSLTKNQILERYLNTIYWGRGAYGIQAASQAYFGENVQELTLPQAALLAGLIRGPELADPVSDPAVALGRRAESLASMVRYHKITQVQADAANASPLPTTLPNASQQADNNIDSNNHAQYFLNYVEQQLEQRYPLGLGLRVTTTLDLGMQDEAWNAMYGSQGLTRTTGPVGALVAVDDNGFVKAMIGGRTYVTGTDQSEVNLALGTAGGGSGRQAGSTFKPFLLAQTLSEGYSVNSTFAGPPTVDVVGQGKSGADYVVNNFDNEDAGPSVSLITATAQSINTVYAQLEMAIGPAKLVAMAEQMGLSPSDVGLGNHPSLVLGTAQVSVLEMAAAYATFARGGNFLSPQVITKVTTANGTVLPWASPAPKQILTPKQDEVLEYCLQQVVAKGGTGVGASFNTPIAGKTGTTSSYTDAWFIGFTPKLTTAVWIGYEDGTTSMLNLFGKSGGVVGGDEPDTLWRHFMIAATQNGPGPIPPTPGPSALPPHSTWTGPLIKSPTNLVSFPKGMGTPTTTTGATHPATADRPRAPPRLVPLTRPHNHPRVPAADHDRAADRYHQAVADDGAPRATPTGGTAPTSQARLRAKAPYMTGYRAPGSLRYQLPVGRGTGRYDGGPPAAVGRRTGTAQGGADMTPGVTAPAVRARKGGEPLVMITAYDAPGARIADAAGVDMILVGDSLAMVVLGYDDTLSVTVADMEHHTAAVARAKPRPMVVADLPWMSYHLDPKDAVRNAARLIRAGAQAVKLEGGRKRLPVVEAILDAEIPVMGHLGLTPQSLHMMGGFKVQGREVEAVEALIADAVALAAAGCFAIVLEGVPDTVAAMVTDAVPVPTIGIGAGPSCDGQVLVLHDVLGLEDRVLPKFVRRYASLKADAVAAVAAIRKRRAQPPFSHLRRELPLVRRRSPAAERPRRAGDRPVRPTLTSRRTCDMVGRGPTKRPLRGSTGRPWRSSSLRSAPS